MRLVLLGHPGAGKGTQAAAVAKELGLAHIASGDLFREAVEKGTELGLQARSYMEQGELVPNEVTIKMVLERLQAAEARDGFILDGFPRTVPQAVGLGVILERLDVALDAIVAIEVNQDVILTRLAARRSCVQ